MNKVQNGAGEAYRSPSDQFRTEKGVPGDGDALLFFCGNLSSAGNTRTGTLNPGQPLRFDLYLVIVPQAIRSPAFPAGSDFMSSALA